MADPLGIIGFIGSMVALSELAFRSRHIYEKTQGELERQWSEYDLLGLIAQEAADSITSHGRPTEAVETTMKMCANRGQTMKMELRRIEKALERRRHKKFIMLWVSMNRRNQRRFAWENFRDVVLLLRDLSYSMQTSRQLTSVIADLSDAQDEIVEGNDQSVRAWNPAVYEQETGIELRNILDSKIPQPPQVRSLQKALVRSNYTFDAIILRRTETGIKYIPARGLWDTGSDGFMISQSVLDRADISQEEVEPLDGSITLHGVGGAVTTPDHRITLDWHVAKNMNSRRDTFFILDKADFDILVPWKLRIGARHTAFRSEGENALILTMRRKSEGEIQRERRNEIAALKQADAARKAYLEKQQKEREKQIQRRSAQTGGPAAGGPGAGGQNP